MIICIIAGGEGTRLWPLSQPHRPKHLLPLVDDKSLLQNTYDRAANLTDTIFVISEISHAAEVARQLPDLPEERLIIEPGRRGTAGCIILTLAELNKMGLDDTVCFISADQHIVELEDYYEALRTAVRVSEVEKKITLVGLKPTYPAVGFGYIEQAGKLEDDVYDVASFHEKPDAARAAGYLADGKYLWNLSLFAAPQEVFIRDMTKYAPDLKRGYDRLLAAKSPEDQAKNYLELESDAIDYALIEKTKNTLVVAGKFGWADLGSFGDLYEVLRNEDENVQKGTIVEMLDCTNSMVLGHSDRPVVAIGLKDVVIVDSPDGLLVVEASQAQRVKEALANIKKKAR